MKKLYTFLCIVLMTCSATIASAQTEDYTITLNKATDGYYYGTYSSPYNLVIPAGIGAYSVKIEYQSDGKTPTGKLTLEEVSGIFPSYYGILFKSKSSSIKLTSTEDAETITTDLIGTPDGYNATADYAKGATYYTLNEVNKVVGFYKFTGSDIPAERAYLMIDDDNPLKASEYFNFNFGTTTGISHIANNAPSLSYDLSGRTTQSTKGFQIKGGKKVIIK